MDKLPAGSDTLNTISFENTGSSHIYFSLAIDFGFIALIFSSL